jgi:hypothetical protein
MQGSIRNLIAAFLVSGFVPLYAQQAPAPPPPANPALPGVQNQPEIRNPAVRLQPNQQGRFQRMPQRQNFAPQVNRNNRDPREQLAIDAEQRRQEEQNQQQGQAGEGQINDSTLLFGGGSYGGGGGGAVTMEQAQGLAAAEVIRSAGEFNRNTAAAEVLHERARAQAVNNHYAEVDNYFEVRRLNRQERNAERGPMPTQEDVLRYSKSRVPERLSAMALDRHSGAINWPAALMAPEFDQHRARLEQIFQARSYYNSGLASPSYLEIKEEADRMLATLQERVRQMDPASYVQARKFIVGLGFEGRFAAGSEEVALRS